MERPVFLAGLVFSWLFCADLGMEMGSLGCTASCELDLSSCVGDRCAAEFLYNDGWCDDCELYGGSEDPDCADCALDDDLCAPPDQLDPVTNLSTCLSVAGSSDPDCGVCGDGMASATEFCDGTDLGQRTCQHFGFWDSLVQPGTLNLLK